MPKISRKVIPYESNYLCDSCKSGMMMTTGVKDTAGYEHKCVICNEKAILKMEFPHVEYYGEGESPGTSS